MAQQQPAALPGDCQASFAKAADSAIKAKLPIERR
jgi:hypothetical protein